MIHGCLVILTPRTRRRRTPGPLRWSLPLLLAITAGGCVGPSGDNRLFPVTEGLIASERMRMSARPVSLERPLVVLAGYRTGLHQPEGLRRRLAQLISAGDPEGRRTLAIAYAGVGDIHAAARRVVERIEEAFPSDDPHRTTEVDVVGVSMGGLVARYAAMGPPARPESFDEPPTKRLHIARLFTIATPHRGARAAEIVTPDQAARDMRPGSPFLQRLDEALPGIDFELIAYARTNDALVGEENTAPPGVEPIWAPGPALFSHFTAAQDWSIAVDIARRLRGEWPLGFAGSAPPRR